jgi:hypothetical protein
VTVEPGGNGLRAIDPAACRKSVSLSHQCLSCPDARSGRFSPIR